MDKQLLLEFKKLYFGKEQIERRVYDKEELEEVWNVINEERKLQSNIITIKNNNRQDIWYNITNDITEGINYINRNSENELINYLSQKNAEKLMKNTEVLEVASNVEIDNNKMNFKLLEKLISKKSSEKLILESQLLVNLYNIINNLDYSTFNFDKESIKNIYFMLVKGDSNKEVVISENKIDELLKVVNEDDSRFPIINAAIIQFYILNTIPFSNHNGVMARALSYCYLISCGYEILRYVSPSHIMLNEKKKYRISVEASDSSDGDVTYFIKYYISAIKNALENFNKEIAIKHGKRIIQDLIDKKNVNLENRQIHFINDIISSEKSIITIYDYKDKEEVSYETARTDLNNLVTLGFFKIGKNGKKYEYYVNNISTIIESFEE